MIGVVAIDLFAGVVAHVTPVAPFTRQLIKDRVKELYPDLDTTPYMIKLEDSLDPNALYLDTANEEYQINKAQLEAKRVIYEQRLIVEMAVSFEASEDELIAKYKRRLKKLREINPEEEDDWSIVLHQILLARNTDLNQIWRVATDNLPLDDGEVSNGMKIFRAKLPGSNLSATSRQPSGT